MYLYSQDNTNYQTGLAFYEGSHTSNSGVVRQYSKSDLDTIAAISNDTLKKTYIPVYNDHNPGKGEYGKIESLDSFEVRPISLEDVSKNPKLENLLGKIGLFIKNIQILNEDFLTNISKGLGKKISVAINPITNAIEELSIVGNPALTQATLFSHPEKDLLYFTNHKDLPKVDNHNYDYDILLKDCSKKKEYEEILDKLFAVFKQSAFGILNSSVENLNGENPDTLIETNFEKFGNKLLPLLKNNINLTDMKLTDMLENSEYNSEFENNLEYALPDPFKKRKKKTSMIGKVAKTAATVGAVAGAGAGAYAGRKQIGTAIKQGINKIKANPLVTKIGKTPKPKSKNTSYRQGRSAKPRAGTYNLGI